MSTDRVPIRVTHLIHDLRPGGAEHVLVDLGSVARAAGLEVSVVSMRPLGDFGYSQQLQESGVELKSLDLSGWWDPRGPQRLRRLLLALRPEILHSHLKHADVVAGRVARAAAIPHVSTLHLIEADVGFLAGLKRDLGTRSRLRTAQRTIAVSDAVRRWYLEVSDAHPDSVVTIHNGVPDPGSIDPTELAAVRAEFGIDSDAVLVLMVAVMRPGKGHDVLLDSLEYLQADNVVFLLAGDGPEFADLRRRAGDDQRVRFGGFRHDIDRLLMASDLVVHPSLDDALPTALLHALATARPIVASDVGGIPEIVSPRVGALIPPGDPVALAAAIDRIGTEPDARRWMGKAAREQYDAEFTVENWAGRLHALYAEILDRI